MNEITKECKQCGKVLPLEEGFHKCRANKDGFNRVCKACNTAKRLQYPRLDRKDYIIRADKELQEHKEKLVDMPTLTEKEWIDTCRHFKKCALCKEEEIASKHYFVRFLDGGRCSKNNIVPLCNDCAEFCRREVVNMYYLKHKRLRRKWQNKKYKENTNVLQIIDYLLEVNERGKTNR